VGAVNVITQGLERREEKVAVRVIFVKVRSHRMRGVAVLCGATQRNGTHSV